VTQHATTPTCQGVGHTVRASLSLPSQIKRFHICILPDNSNALDYHTAPGSLHKNLDERSTLQSIEIRHQRESMMIGRDIRLAAMSVLSIALMLPLAASAAKQPPQSTFDGLELQPDTKLAVVYLRPGVDFSGYRRVALLEPGVAFRKNWQRDQNSTNPLAVSKKDMEDIRKALGALFLEVFREQLTKGGYELTDQAGDDVLVLRPAIIDLDISAPAAAEMGRSRTFATSAGAMTLYLEVYDADTNEILGRAVDRKETRDYGRMMWQNAATNKTEARRLLTDWADTLRNGLDAIRATRPAPIPAP
jgi:hypothetical protein